MSTGDMLAGGLGLLVGLVGVVAYAMGFKAGMMRAYDEASRILKDVFKS